MNNTLQQSLVINKDYLVSLVTDAYSMGLAAGQNVGETKDDPDFGTKAAGLFSSGFSDMLAEPLNALEA